MLTLFMRLCFGSETEIIGYYSFNYATGSYGPPDANAGAAYTGHADVGTAIREYPEGAIWCCPYLVGEKYLTLGGAGDAGDFDVDTINDIANSVDIIKNSTTEYDGVLFNIKIVSGNSSTELIEAFAAAFKALKEGGLKVGVSPTHSAPVTYPADVAVDLVESWVKDSNIDFLSPQLYTEGMEDEGPKYHPTEYCENEGCTWSLYHGMIPRMVPSILTASLYNEAQRFFSVMGIQTTGFFQWIQQETPPVPTQQPTAHPEIIHPEIIGYYSFNYATGSYGPPGANAGAAYTGHADVGTAIREYPEGVIWCCPYLVGEKYLTLGGAGDAGDFDVATINDIANSVDIIKNSTTEYDGVLFNIKIVSGNSSTELIEAFAAAFKAIKEGGLKVGVSPTHSAPVTYPADVAVDLVESWVKDSNIDFLSPQLYTEGMEDEGPKYHPTEYCENEGCTWSLYDGMIPRMVPSILNASLYNQTQRFFSVMGIQTTGFFQWNQQVDTGSPTSAPTTSTSDCVEIEQNWTKEIAEQLCSVGQMGHTNKGVDAVVCPENNQYYQRRLNYSLANRAYRSCSAWCVYDSHPEGYGDASETFIWRKRGCWEPTRTGLCIFGNTQERELMAEYVEYTLCKPCIPFNTWSEDRAEEICPSIVSAGKSYGAEVCDDPNSSTKQDNLDKSLANRFFAQCTSYCVYDYETIMSNGGSYGGFMWKQTCWKWVTSWDCFGKHISEFTDVSSRAANFCE